MRVLLLIFVVSTALANPVLEKEDTSDLTVTEDNIHIYFYSQAISEGKEITHKNYHEDMSQTDFNNTKKTVFVVHGWHNDYTSTFCDDMRKAYLPKYDINVFVVDWHEVAQAPYLVAFLAVPDVAATLSKLIGPLVQQQGLSLDKTTIVGHSLGAHIAGITGSDLKGQTDTIIGLDPAGPGFVKERIDNRLDETDAKFVQALHTCPGVVGEEYAVGHADYYANKGIFQPGCPLDPLTGLRCAHARAYLYFAESLTGGPFNAVQCKDYKTYESGSCVDNPVSKMGQFEVDKTASGTYFFLTNAAPPFAKV